MEHCLPGLHRQTAPDLIPQRAAPLWGCGSRFAPERGEPASAGPAGKPRGPALPGACGLPGEKHGAQPPGTKPRRVLRSTDATHLHHLGLKERDILLHDLRSAAPDTPVRRQTPFSLRSSSFAVSSTSFNSGPARGQEHRRRPGRPRPTGSGRWASTSCARCGAQLLGAVWGPWPRHNPKAPAHLLTVINKPSRKQEESSARCVSEQPSRLSSCLRI